ncbi:Adult-specific rigid cuticular protein 15.7 [Araneus ventricosus]|uniref:Adult-specific rigid cuticular protein 15.7 n=1 Tax=Araneus ventricosus TaxID=182803 RepID=A0A4Y2IKX7_ARAVE|nr:Adult-specific rigid cuticular protein 15.7 [Araneus ventricosus]
MAPPKSGARSSIPSLPSGRYATARNHYFEEPLFSLPVPFIRHHLIRLLVSSYYIGTSICKDSFCCCGQLVYKERPLAFGHQTLLGLHPLSTYKPTKMIAKVAILCLAFVAVNASGLVHTGSSVSSRTQDGYGNYAFGYDIKDGLGATNSRSEVGDAHGNKKGAYTIHDIDGRARRVEYVADAHGFRAAIKTNEPGTAASAPAAAVIASPYAGPVAPVAVKHVAPVAYAAHVAAPVYAAAPAHLGYGAHAGAYGHGAHAGAYGHGAHAGAYGHGAYGHGAYGDGAYGHGAYGHGAYGHGPYGHGAYGHGAYGHHW